MEAAKTFWEQAVDRATKVAILIATLGSIIGATASTYWATKADNAATREQVKDLSSSMREGSASLREDLAQIAVQTQKDIVQIREAVTAMGKEADKHITVLHDRTKEQDAVTELRKEIKRLDEKMERRTGDKRPSRH